MQKKENTMELFQLLGKITIDASGVDEAVSTTKSKMETLGEKITSVGEKISSVGTKLTLGVTAPLVGLGTAAIKSTSTFEDAMAKVSTIADESEMSMNDMEQAILDLSNQTGVSANAIAEDVYNAISAGQKTADAVNFVSNSTKLARAGFAETGQSLDLLTTIMNAYGLEAGEVTRVSDILIQTQNLGKTTVGDLSSAMGKVIPTAKSYNVSLEQVASAYTITTAKGIATAESTTYINSMLNELGKSGTTVSNTLKSKTGKSFAELMSEGYSLGDCLEIVEQAAKEQNLAFNDMWGSAEAAKAGVTLLGDSAEAFNSRLVEMNNVTGLTDTAFEKLETTSYKTQKAINEAKNILIDLGGVIIEMLLPYLEKGAEKIHQFAEWFKNLDDGTKKLIITIAGIVAAVGPVLTVGGKIIGGVGQIVEGIGRINRITNGGLASAIKGVISNGGKVATGIGSLVGKIGGSLIPAIAAIPTPVKVVIAILAALVVAGVAVYKNWDEICAWGREKWAAIQETIGNVVEGIKTFFHDLKENVSEKFHQMTESIAEKAMEIKDKVSEKFSEMKEAVVSKIVEIKDNAVEKFHELQEKAAEKVNELKEKTAAKFEEIKEKASAKAAELKEKVVSKVEEMKENTSAKINEMGEKVANGFQDMKEKAAEKFHDLKEKWTSKFTETKEKMISEAEEMKQKVGDKLEELKTHAIEKIDSLKTNAVQKFVEMKDRVAEKLFELSRKGVEGFNTIREKGSSAISSLKDFMVSKFTEMGTSAESKFSAIADRIMSIFTKARDGLSHIVETVKGFFNFDWHLPDIKLPHFKIDGSFSLNPPSIPSFGVEWYAKGGVMEEPTAFGINPYSGNVMVGGEAGAEAVAPIETLKAYIREAVDGSNMQLYGLLNAILSTLNKYLPELAERQIVMNTGVLVGELSEPMFEAFGRISHNRERRN